MMVFGAVWGAAAVVFRTETLPEINQRVRSVQAVGVLSQITLVLMTTAMCTLSFRFLEMLLLHLYMFTFLRPPALLPVSEPDSTASSLHTVFDHTSPLTLSSTRLGLAGAHFTSFPCLSWSWTAEPEQRNLRNYKYEFYLRLLANVAESK